MSTGTAPLASPATPTRIGSFIAASTSSITQSADATSIQMTGAEDSGFAGRSAIARTAPVPGSPDKRAQIEVALAKLRHLTHGAFSPVLETGIQDQLAFWVFAEPVGKPLSGQEPNGDWSISRVHELVKWLGGALQIAHDVGLSHGTIDADSIYLQGDGSPELFGLGPNGAGPGQDQHDLAMVAIQLLGGGPWVEKEPPLDPDADLSAWRSQQLREFLPECTPRISACLARATEPDPSRRYPSMAAFVSGFDDAMRMSAEDLVHGAYEAISAQSPELARLLADRAATYDRNCEGLTLLNLQLRGESPFRAASFPSASDDAPSPVLDAPEMADPLATPDVMVGSLAVRKSLLPPELTQGLPQEFLDSIAPQFDVKPVKKGMNPMLILTMGGIGMVLLLAIAGLATFLLSGS